MGLRPLLLILTTIIMRKVILYTLLLAVALVLTAANTKYSGTHYEYIVVDTDPDAAGFWTEPVQSANSSRSKVTVFVAGTGTMTFTLQYRGPDGNWYDYYVDGVVKTYATNARETIDDPSREVRWRIGVKDADYTSGSKTAGFDY